MTRLRTLFSKNRYLPLMLCIIGWLVLLELILRLPPVKARLDRYAQNPVWYSPYVPQRIKLIRNNQDADVWFVGSSTVVLGVKPEAIDPLLNGQTTTKHKTLNLGLLGMLYIENLESYIYNAFLPYGKPKILVLGAFPVLFAYSPKGYIENSPEYEATKDRSTEPNRQVAGWLYDHFALYKLVHTFRNVIAETPVQQISDTPTGYVGVDATITDIVPAEGNSATNDLLDKNLALLKRLNANLKARGIQLAFMSMPVYNPEMKGYPGGFSNYQDYITRLTRFLADEKIPFLDVWQALEDKYDQQLPAADFMDVPHLSDTGANDVAPFIAQFLAKILEPPTSPSS